jgi:hypothetical protein
VKLVRTATAVAVAGTLVGAGISQAAVKAKPKPKPVCNIVSDVKGDADIAGGVGQDDSLDIVSADLASDKQTVTAVVRVVKASAVSAIYKYGSTWRVNFTVNGVALSISAVSDRSGVVGQYTYTDATGGHIIASDGVVTIDQSTNEVRISVPTSAFGEHANLKPGTLVEKISATTGAIANTPAGNLRFPTVDVSDTTDGTYKTGNASCVKPGK